MSLPAFHFDHIKAYYEFQARALARAQRHAQWQAAWTLLIMAVNDYRFMSQPA